MTKIDTGSQFPDTFLKLNFNERSDKPSLAASDFSMGESGDMSEALWRYPERQSVEKQIAELNGLKDDQVLCTNGGDEAIYLLMRLIKEEKSLILPLPAFSQYTWGIKSWGIDATIIPAKNDLSVDISATLAAIENTKNSVTIITRPNNPTGEYICDDDLNKMIEAAKKNNSWIFLDEAYIEFSEAASHNGSSRRFQSNCWLERFDNLIVLRTLSKAFGLAGIRFGYLLGSSTLIDAFVKRCMPFNIPYPSLVIAKRALESENLNEVNSYCEKIISNRTEITNWLLENNIAVCPSKANFILLRLKSKQAQAVYNFLKKNEILTKIFDDTEIQNCLRIGIPTDISRLFPLLKKALGPELVCMDMDGVLIDTSGSYDQAVMQTVETLSNKKVALADIELLRRQGGYNNDWVLSQKLLERLGVNLSLDEVTQVFQDIYLGKQNKGLVRNESALIKADFVQTILDANADTSKSIKFAIVTGRPRPEAKAGQELVGLQSLDLVSLDDVSQGKPSPEGINGLQERYSGLTWMCGDNPDDMQAAAASSSLAIGIGSKNSKALYAAGADIVVDDINHIQDWLV